jgi:hypothetical protein
MPDLARFLYAIEHADFWADVSYLKIDTGRNPAAPESTDREALLTFSLFSAPPPEAPAPVKKG